MQTIRHADHGQQSLKVPTARPGDQQVDPDAPRWSDRQVAVMLALENATGRAQQRLGLPGWYRGSFRERCRAVAAQLGRYDAGHDRAAWWTGIDDEPAGIEQLRGLPPELAHLRRPA